MPKFVGTLLPTSLPLVFDKSNVIVWFEVFTLIEPAAAAAASKVEGIVEVLSS